MKLSSRELPSGVDTVEGKCVDKGIGVDWFCGDPVGGEIPGAAVDQSGDSRAHGPPFLCGIVKDSDPCIKCTAVADDTVAGGDFGPVPLDKVDTHITCGGFAFPCHDYGLEIHVGDVIPCLIDRGDHAFDTFDAHFFHSHAISGREIKFVQVEIKGVKILPENLFPFEGLSASGVTVAKKVKGCFIINSFSDISFPVSEIVVKSKPPA